MENGRSSIVAMGRTETTKIRSRHATGRRPPWFWLGGLNLAGIALIAVPDADNRLFSFSETHGPAPSDLAGSLLLVLGWAILDTWTWKHRRSFSSHGLRRRLSYLLVPALAGIAIVAWSIGNDEGWWWLLGAAVTGGVQVAAAVMVTGARAVAAT
ncbi:MAG TPA: hypothetical protein VHL54_03225 [Actinomycetota bacterium]|nr:hypothetical protein [Actinomycetota bacterium]